MHIQITTLDAYSEDVPAKKGSCRDSNAGPLARLLRYPKRELNFC
jgi:hypothetical protein